MITIRDWIATIPDTDKHIAYVGEENCVFREFLLTGTDWKVYRNWTFYLDMAFDLSSVTKKDSKQVVTTQQDVTENVTEAVVKTTTSGKKETYTVESVEVDAPTKTDVAYLTKQEREDGLYLRWKVEAQQTRLPGKLTATLRAMGLMGEVKKSALMVFEVDPAVVAEPAAPINRNTFELMMDEMNTFVEAGYEQVQATSANAALAQEAAQTSVTASAEAMVAASDVAITALAIKEVQTQVQKAQAEVQTQSEQCAQMVQNAGAYAQEAKTYSQMAENHEKTVREHTQHSAENVALSASYVTEAQAAVEEAKRYAADAGKVVEDAYAAVEDANAAVEDAHAAVEDAHAAMESVVSDIAALRNDTSVNLMTDEHVWPSHYINANHQVVMSDSWTGYVITEQYSQFIFRGYTNNPNNYAVGFYASDIPSDDTLIQGISWGTAGTLQLITIDQKDIPTGTRSILFCTRHSSGLGSSLVGVSTTVNDVANVTAAVESVAQEVDEIHNWLLNESSQRVFGKGNIRAIYRDIPNSNDFAIVGDELWLAQHRENDTLVHRYRIVEDKLVPVARNILTDFGHWNCVDYNAENDCLVFGNAANAMDTEGNFFSVVPHPRAIEESATLDTHAICYPVDIGYKVQAVWGDGNLGKNNVVYLFANDAKAVVKVMLKQNEDGSFYKNLNTGCGEYIILETRELSTRIGVGGGDFWGDTLYIGDGDYHGYKEMSMTDYSVKSVSKRFYRDDGTKISGSTQGIHVDSDYLWVYYNVAYATQERQNESYLVQYYR